MKTNKNVMGRSKCLTMALSLVITLVWSVSIHAQNNTHRHNSPKEPVPSVYATVCSHYLDSLQQLKKSFQYWKYMGTDTLSNPYYYGLFLTPSLYGDVTSRVFSRHRPETPVVQSVWEQRLNAIDDALAAMYVEHPEWVKHNLASQKDDKLYIDNPSTQVNEVSSKVKLTEKVKDKHQDVVSAEQLAGDWDIAVMKPNFWNFSANTSLQFTQNHYSDNWYQGGESNSSLLATINIDANFDNKKKLIFNNKLEMRLGFQTSKNDDKHKLITNSDLIRLTNKLGVKAVKHWNYALTLQSWTQFYPGYRKNDDRVYSDFMSPFESLLTIGMDYSLNVKKFNITAAISPLAADFKYSSRKKLAPGFGINNGKQGKVFFGSNVTINYTWQIIKNMSWRGRIYYFTNYDKVQMEWENTINFQFNKYISTKLFLYPRFDDSARRTENGSYFQFQELLSLGLNYTF